MFPNYFQKFKINRSSCSPCSTNYFKTLSLYPDLYFLDKTATFFAEMIDQFGQLITNYKCLVAAMCSHQQ